MKNEIWKLISGCNGIYEVSSLGRIRNTLSNNILRQQKTAKGYLSINISKNKRRNKYQVHRLVALEFIYNEFNKEQVNHKNGIKTDNRVENLEWVTNLENAQHSWKYLGRIGGLTGRLGKEHNSSKPVYQFTKDGKFIQEFESTRHAERETRIWHTHISACCLGKIKSSGGYKWKYEKNL